MKKFNLIALIGMVLILGSCSLDHNTSPNDVISDDLTPNLRLSAAEVTAYEPLAGDMNGLGNIWTNAWAGNTAQFGNPLITESTLDISTSFRQAMWNDMYRAIARFQQIINVEEPENYPNYVAIAKIQKAFYMEYIVDLYGDVPYTEAFQEQENLTPKYDKDVDIYKDLVQELLDARDLIGENLGNPDETLSVAASDDVIFGGDMKAWEKFANTVLLRFAIHLSETTDSEGQDLRNQIISELSGAEFMDSDVTINPGYSNSSDTKQNPLYNNFGRGTSSGQINTQGYQLMTGSLHIIQNLLGDASKNTSGVSDPRIGEMFMPVALYNGDDEPVAEGYDGFEQGDTNNDFKVARGFSSSNQNPSNSNVSLLGGSFYDFPGGAELDGYLMMLSEIEFLQAEAAVRGYAGFGDAQGHFVAGVQASLDFYDVDSEDADEYISDINGVAQVGWTGNTNDDIAAIQYQRWIALTNYNGIENYINYLRTGYPETPMATTANHPNKPYRLLYPASEYSSNSANVPDVSIGQMFEKNEFTPFIYK